jgi:conserved oligomeric Golgi complex subunit 8
LEAQLNQVCFTNYTKFISSNQDSNKMIELKEKKKEMNEILNQLNSLKNHWNEFSSIKNESTSQNKGLVSILNHYDEISSLLEIPTLSQLCIRNHLYSECLDLNDFVYLFSERNPSCSTMIGSTNAEELLVQTLIQQLQENISVPESLKIMSHLKRMFSNQIEFDILFLQQRLKYQQEEEEEEFNTYSHVSIERTHSPS